MAQSNTEYADEADQSASHYRSNRGRGMTDLLIIIGFVGFWFALQMWILPSFGVST